MCLHAGPGEQHSSHQPLLPLARLRPTDPPARSQSRETRRRLGRTDACDLRVGEQCQDAIACEVRAAPGCRTRLLRGRWDGRWRKLSFWPSLWGIVIERVKMRHIGVCGARLDYAVALPFSKCVPVASSLPRRQPPRFSKSFASSLDRQPRSLPGPPMRRLRRPRSTATMKRCP